ncbi:unnamed protein product [Blepharisma stoltei]|uniref:Uncharacterized protein n=1 Tax=Blepharisma stoltei TaxID=1481888 RepID=A0AAU9KJP7_9CILI|nr:unnamed protein product [Blepharisma stoltei]
MNEKLFGFFDRMNVAQIELIAATRDWKEAEPKDQRGENARLEQHQRNNRAGIGIESELEFETKNWSKK